MCVVMLSNGWLCVCAGSVVAASIPVVKHRQPKGGVAQKASRRREPSLTLAYPSKVSGSELQIVAQPEEQHRARYLTEGSRGAVKDTSQQGHPMVKVRLPHG